MDHPLKHLMDIANVAECFVPVLSLAAYVPQWRRLITSRDSSSISISSWAIWAVSYAIALFYAVTLMMVTGRGWPLVATTSLGLCFVLFTIVLIRKYRNTGTADMAITSLTPETQNVDQQSRQA